MFGCHNCEKKPAPGTPYEQSPCATCKTLKNPPPASHYRDDPGTFQVLSVQHPSQKEPQSNRVETGDASEFFTTVIRAFSQSLRILVNLKEKHPRTYRILEAKLDDPSLSYADLALRFSCRKQNVQYHLKKSSFVLSGAFLCTFDRQPFFSGSSLDQKEIFDKKLTYFNKI